MWPSRHKPASQTIKLWTKTVFSTASFSLRGRLDNTHPCLNYHCISVVKHIDFSVLILNILILISFTNDSSFLLSLLFYSEFTHTHTHNEVPTQPRLSSVCLTPSGCLIVDCRCQRSFVTGLSEKKTAMGLPQVNKCALFTDLLSQILTSKWSQNRSVCIKKHWQVKLLKINAWADALTCTTPAC